MPIPSHREWMKQTYSRLSRSRELQALDAAIQQYELHGKNMQYFLEIKGAFDVWKSSQGGRACQQSPWWGFQAMRNLDQELSRMPNTGLAGLARSDVVGLRHARNQQKYAQETYDAMRRFLRYCQSSKIKLTATQLQETFDKMLKLLSDARATINFKAGSFFENKNKAQSYQNFWERGTTGGTADPERRDQPEMQLGNYNGGQPIQLKGVSGQNVWGAEQRIKSFGIRSAQDFQPAFRPRYGTLDYGYYQFGGCGKYGRSFFVLKEHMKHNATYTHLDSFKVEMDLKERRNEFGGVKTLDDVTATYHELVKILLYCNEVMFKAIYEYASGKKAKGSETGGLALLDVYIEAQFHADVQFKRDVESVFVSLGEMGPDRATQDRVGRNANLFGTANGVKVVFY